MTIPTDDDATAGRDGPGGRATGHRPGGTDVVGWREWLRLPGLTEQPVKVKVDTGARTSSLHAFDLEVTGDHVTFEVHPHQGRDDDASRVTLPLHDTREVRPSTGDAEERPVVVVDVELGDARFPIEVTLTDRDAMGFRMLLGRTAIAGRYVVDPSSSYRQGRRPRRRPVAGASD